MANDRLIAPGEVEFRREGLTLVDVREDPERSMGYIPGSIHLPMETLTGSIQEVIPQASTTVVLYCATGVRSAIGAEILAEMGYESVLSLDGGFQSWKEESRPWTNPSQLTADQLERYSRHIAIPQVGAEGQARLLDSRIAIIGAGGLGSPVALYLAAAGVGTIGIIDHDSVDGSNLQRQIIHSLDQIGRLKVESARERLTALNPDVKVEPHHARLEADNVLETLTGYDVIVDATDNFPTRYLINDASMHLHTPVVHASIYRFEGQVSVFDPYLGPCYRCLFPAPPPADIAVSCDTGGVLGVLPGVIGSLQATEALKLALGIGETLVGRLMVFDALNGETSEVRFSRDPDCAACGDESSPPKIIDYDEACQPA